MLASPPALTVTELAVPGVLLIEPRVFRDERGFFLETFRQERYAAYGMDAPFVQENHSRSRRNTLRGLHFQRRRPQGKLVRVARGAVYDVAVDVRPDSPTFGQHVGVTLSDENHRQLWLPPGLAHGFCVLSEEADFLYACTEPYDASDEGGVCWDDPDLDIPWPVAQPMLSARDRALPPLRDLAPDDLPVVPHP
jgi:dTDP-4-dehydrorhamnose 3,5-epimerase